MSMRCLSVLLFIFCSSSLFGQQVLLSPSEYLSSNSSAIKIIGKVKDKTVCFVENSKAYELLWYDSLMRKLAVSKLDFLEKGAERIRFNTTEEAVYVFYQRKKRKNVNLWAAKIAPIDKDTIVPVLIDSIVLKDGWDKTRFEFFNNTHTNRFVYAASRYDKRTDRLSLMTKVLDDRFTVVNEAFENMTNVAYHDMLSVLLDKNDGVHILYGEPTSRSEQLQNVLVGSKSRGVTEMKFTKLDLRSYNLGDGRFVLNEKSGQIYLVGLLYREDYKTVAAVGGFIYDPIAQEFARSNFTTLRPKDALDKSVLTNMRLRKLMLKESGGYAVILEKSFQETFQRSRSIGFVSPGLGMSSSRYDIYHNDEIMVFDIKKSGTVNWFETIVKVQETTDADQRYQSYGQLQSPMGNVFLFTDQNNGNNRFINAFLSNNGELQLKQFTAKGAEAISESGMLLRNAKQIGANEIVFPLVKRGTLSFAKIVY